MGTVSLQLPPGPLLALLPSLSQLIGPGPEPDSPLFTNPMLLGLALGFLWALGLYFLGLYATLRDRTFLYYTGFVCAMSGFVLTVVRSKVGLGPPEGWSWSAVAFVLTASASAGSYPLFVRCLLGAARIGRGPYRLLGGVAAGAAATLLLLIPGWWEAWSLALLSLTVPLVAGVLTAMARTWRQGYAPAGILMLASAVVAAGSVGVTLSYLFAPVPYALEALVLGVCGQTLLMAYAVAWRVRELRTERARAINARHRAEAANAELREALALKANLLGFAVHDLRSPLTGIRGFAQLVEDEAEGEALAEYGALIGSSAERLMRLIDDLLTTAELDTGAPIRTEPVDLAALVAEALPSLRALAGAKGQRLHLDAEPGSCARVDADRFAEVVDNLVSNAIKYTPPQGEICVSVTAAAGQVQLRVADSGPGFSADDHLRLFRPFTRLSAQPTGGEASTGLGLAIVKRIVDLHEGTLKVENRSGGGAAISVTLDLAPEPAPAA